MTTYTTEQKKDYFKALRSNWQKNKEASQNDADMKAKYDAIRAESPTYSISYTGFYFAAMQMQAQGLDGIPYIDAKTFNGWRDAGFKVKKGEHSKIDGITWVSTGSNEDGAEDEKKLFPKRYALFHKTQVETL